MNKFTATIAASLAAVAFPATAAPLPAHAQYLFTIAASSGTFAGDTLTLDGVPLVVYFADRPTRVAGHMDLQAFVGLWDKGVDDFKNDPPNAELSIYHDGGDKHAVLILSGPVLDGDNISFKVSSIDETIPASFKHSTLFIDDTDVTDVTFENNSKEGDSPTTFSKP